MPIEFSPLIAQVLNDSTPVITSIIRDTVYLSPKSFDLLDSTRLVPLITGLIAIISVIVSNINTKKQLKISEEQLKRTTENFEKQLEANRKFLHDDNLIKMRKEWLQEFSKISCAISEVMYKFTMSFLEEIEKDRTDLEKTRKQLKNQLEQIQFLDSQLKLKITLEGEQLSSLHAILDDFIKDIFVEQNLNHNDIKNRLAISAINFEKESQNIIREQISKLIL